MRIALRMAGTDLANHMESASCMMALKLRPFQILWEAQKSSAARWPRP